MRLHQFAQTLCASSVTSLQIPFGGEAVPVPSRRQRKFKYLMQDLRVSSIPRICIQDKLMPQLKPLTAQCLGRNRWISAVREQFTDRIDSPTSLENH